MNIAFFDFDGTITTKDSLLDFIAFAVGKPLYYWGLLLLSPMLVVYALKLIPNDKAKQILISYYFKGWSIHQFEQIAEQYALGKMLEIIRPNALEVILNHQQQGDEVVIVSASMENWLHAWCDRYGLALIGTRLEVSQGKLTGKFASKNCYGNEKVKRIKQLYNLKNYDCIYAYGDSNGDKPMLQLADKPYMRAFH